MKKIACPVWAGILVTGVIMPACDDDPMQPSGDTVMIGSQEWTTRNLDVDTFQNGDPIPEARSGEAWYAASQERRPAWCYLDNDPDKGDLYGRLYNYYAITDPRGLAPEGMHIPDAPEWKRLEQYLADNDFDGSALKSVLGWEPESSGASNFTSFSALPGQMRFDSGSFYEGAQLALFWSSDASDAGSAWGRGLHGDVNNFSVFTNKKGAGLSVRRLK